MSALDTNSLDVAEDAGRPADALGHDPPGQVAGAHWNEEAKALLAGGARGVRRDLLILDEVMRLGWDRQLLLRPGGAPALLRKCGLFKRQGSPASCGTPPS